MKKKYFFTFRALINVGIVIAVLSTTIYFMDSRIKKVIEITRDRKSKASGIEYFVKKFKFYDKKDNAYSISDFSNKSIILNYVVSLNDKDTNKLLETQKKLISKLDKKNIIFIFVTQNKNELNDFKLDNYYYDKILLTYDRNLSRDLLDIKNYPYSLMLDFNHRIIGKVDTLQNWDTEEKIKFISNITQI